MADFDEALFHEFVAECREHLEQIEPDLLALETGGLEVPAETVNRVFRAVHSIKGAAGFLGFSAIQGLGHSMENVLMRIRDGEMAPRPDVVDALLIGLDRLARMVGDVDGEGQDPCSDLVVRLDALVAPAPGPPPGAPSPLPPLPPAGKLSFAGDGGLTVRGPPALGDHTFPVDPAALAREVTPVYAVWVRGAEDLAGKGRTLSEFSAGLAPFGSCLASDGGSKGEVPEGAVFHWLFKSVLDPDMVAIALDLPPAQIRRLRAEDLAVAARSEVAASGLSEAAVEEAAAGPTPHSDLPPAAEGKGKADSPPEGAGRTNPVTAPQPETVRVAVELLDRLMDLAGELVLGRNQLRRELEQLEEQRPRLTQLMGHVGQVTSGIQEHIMRLRMQPVGSVLNKFPRVVRDLSRQLAKEVELTVEGAEVELDRSILEGLSDPLTHLVRNCVDHGIESPAEREARGKPRAGSLRLRAFHEGGQVNLTVTDDGAGIDAARVVEKAVARGFLTAAAAESLGDQERLNLILLPGLSTARTITGVSGRGVGMDVVKTNVEKLGGHLELESSPGRGTTVRLRLPLTLAIIPSLVVGAEGQRFAVPQVNVKELVCVRAGDPARRVERAGEADVLRLRGRLLPLVRLADVLGLDRTYRDPGAPLGTPPRADRRGRLGDRRGEGGAPDEAGLRQGAPDRRSHWQSDLYVVVLRAGANRFGLVVDELFDNEEIVVKPLSRYLQECRWFSGATILGDGRVAMILDAPGIAETSNLRFPETPPGEGESDARPADARRALLVFHNALEEQFALPLSSIARLEQVDPREIQRVGGREVVARRGTGVPILRLEQLLPVRPSPPDLEEVFLIVPKSRQPVSAILASRIQDTVEAAAEVRRDPSDSRWVLGTAVLGGRVTTFLDPDELRAAAEAGGARGS
ncbi:MAG: chemotaxis protein CheW [Thermodesulfobacteriota bacterium]